MVPPRTIRFTALTTWEVRVELLVFAVPAAIADELISADLAEKQLPSRGAGEVAQFVLAVTGLAADSVSLVVSAAAVKDVWRKIMAVLRRTPQAEKLRIQVGDHVDITIDLDWLADYHGEVDNIVLRSLGASLINLADRTAHRET
jgi:hypothetical protein